MFFSLLDTQDRDTDVVQRWYDLDIKKGGVMHVPTDNLKELAVWQQPSH
jgi:hypothetical protein